LCPPGLLKYDIQVLTGNVTYAGTDARVFMKIFGKKGTTSEFELRNDAEDLFEKGQTDRFAVSQENNGVLLNIVDHINFHHRFRQKMLEK
jgi:hypothetical protein